MLEIIIFGLSTKLGNAIDYKSTRMRLEQLARYDHIVH